MTEFETKPVRDLADSTLVHELRRRGYRVGLREAAVSAGELSDDALRREMRRRGYYVARGRPRDDVDQFGEKSLIKAVRRRGWSVTRGRPSVAGAKDETLLEELRRRGWVADRTLMTVAHRRSRYPMAEALLDEVERATGRRVNTGQRRLPVLECLLRAGGDYASLDSLRDAVGGQEGWRAGIQHAVVNLRPVLRSLGWAIEWRRGVGYKLKRRTDDG